MYKKDGGTIMKKYFKLLLVTLLFIAISFMSACSFNTTRRTSVNDDTENLSYTINAK